MMKTDVVWREGMAFDVHLDGHSFPIDADAQFGGQNVGPKPKGLMLSALGGCTAMDVRAILTKMRIEIDELKVSVEGDLAEKHPKRFVSMRIRYEINGPADMNTKKIRRAVHLSEYNYCGISATLADCVPMLSEIYINGELHPNFSDEPDD